MKGREVDLFGVDELVTGGLAQIVDVLDEEDIRWGVLREKDDLGAACGQLLDDAGSNAGCSALCIDLPVSWDCSRVECNRRLSIYRHHHDFRVHQSLGAVSRSAEIVFQRGENEKPWYQLEDAIGIGNR